MNISPLEITKENEGIYAANKKGVSLETGNKDNSQISEFSVYAETKVDLQILEKFPNIEILFLHGKFADLTTVSQLKKLKKLDLCSFACDDLTGLLSDCIEYVYLYNLKMENIDFVEKIAGLKKLYLENMPSVLSLPDFSKLPNLKSLKLYEVHKLNDIETLINSSIENLSIALCSDKISGKVFSEIIMQMKKLKQADMHLLDRNDKRYNVLKNHLAKCGKEELLVTDITNEKWVNL